MSPYTSDKHLIVRQRFDVGGVISFLNLESGCPHEHEFLIIQYFKSNCQIKFPALRPSPDL